MSNKNRHVVPNSDGGWDSKKENAERASKHFDTKQEAVDYTRNLAKKDKVEIIIHKKDGEIQRRDSYGNDPYPPKG